MTDLVPKIVVDSAPLPEAERFPYWRQGMSGYEVAPLGAAPFAVKMDCWTVGTLVVTDGTLTPVRFERSRQRAEADGLDHLSFVFLRSGTWTGEINGHDFTMGSGQLVVLDLTRPFVIELGDDGIDSITVSVSRDALERSAPLSALVHGRVLDDAPGRMLADYFLSLTQQLQSLEQAHAAAVARATIGIIAGCLATLPAVPQSSARGLTITIRHRVRRHIDRHLSSRDLSPEAICDALAISRSTLYRAFRPLGGVAGYIQRRRLEAAHAQLSRPLARRISDVAFSYGFASEAHFSNSFRRRFGYSPRQAARGDTHDPAIATIAAMSGASGTALFREWIKTIR